MRKDVAAIIALLMLLLIFAQSVFNKPRARRSAVITLSPGMELISLDFRPGGVTASCRPREPHEQPDTFCVHDLLIRER